MLQYLKRAFMTTVRILSVILITEPGTSDKMAASQYISLITLRNYLIIIHN